MIDKEQAKRMVDDGWAGLIDELYNKKDKNVEISDVKEKFGTLRVYCNFATDEFYTLVDVLEEKSSHICELCGCEGKLRNDLPWFKTLCDKHYEERKKEIKEREEKWKKIKTGRVGYVIGRRAWEKISAIEKKIKNKLYDKKPI